MGTQTRGRPFLQIPGPTTIPDRVLRAMDRAIIDHRGPEFAALVRGLLPDVQRVFKAADGRAAIFPSSGTGAWEASLVNTLAPGDRVLAFDHGHFATLFAAAARNLGLRVDLLRADWRRPIPAEDVERALRDGSPRSFFDWRPIIRENEAGFFPYTPATLVLFGLREALDMLFDEGLDEVFARHGRLADVVRAAVGAWGLEIYCADATARSNSLTGVLVPEDVDSGAVLQRARARGLALGVGLGKVKGKLFRIGHLGSLNELETLAIVAGVELALAESGVRVRLGSGSEAAEEALLGRERVAT